VENGEKKAPSVCSESWESCGRVGGGGGRNEDPLHFKKNGNHWQTHECRPLTTRLSGAGSNKIEWGNHRLLPEKKAKVMSQRRPDANMGRKHRRGKTKGAGFQPATGGKTDQRRKKGHDEHSAASFRARKNVTDSGIPRHSRWTRIRGEREGTRRKKKGFHPFLVPRNEAEKGPMIND